jgi:hypothetical protein
MELKNKVTRDLLSGNVKVYMLQARLDADSTKEISSMSKK